MWERLDGTIRCVGEERKDTHGAEFNCGTLPGANGHSGGKATLRGTEYRETGATMGIRGSPQA